MDVIGKIKNLADFDVNAHMEKARNEIMEQEQTYLKSGDNSASDGFKARFGSAANMVFMGGKYRTAALLALSPETRATYIAGRTALTAKLFKGSTMGVAGCAILGATAGMPGTALGAGGVIGYYLTNMAYEADLSPYGIAKDAVKAMIKSMKAENIDPERVIEGILNQQIETGEPAGTEPEYGYASSRLLDMEERLEHATGMDIETLKQDKKSVFPMLKRQRAVDGDTPELDG